MCDKSHTPVTQAALRSWSLPVWVDIGLGWSEFVGVFLCKLSVENCKYWEGGGGVAGPPEKRNKNEAGGYPPPRGLGCVISCVAFGSLSDGFGAVRG
jgi:hypothetical protein